MDGDAGLVTVEAGVTIRRLNAALAARGLALESFGGDDTRTVGGAISVSAHGSGARYGSLAGLVAALELVTAAGDVLRCSRSEEGDIFAASLVGLGALGVVTAVTLRCSRGFNLHSLEEVQPLDRFLAALDTHDHIRGWWTPRTGKALVRFADRTPEPPSGRGRLRPSSSALRASPLWVAMPGVNRRLPSRNSRLAPLQHAMAAARGRREFTDRSDRVLAATHPPGPLEPEWALARCSLEEVVSSLAAWHRDSGVAVGPRLGIAIGAADEAWLSTAYGRDTAYLTARSSRSLDRAGWPAAFESVMVALGGRPQWGTPCSLDLVALARLYPRWDQWEAVRAALDPQQRFLSAALQLPAQS